MRAVICVCVPPCCEKASQDHFNIQLERQLQATADIVSQQRAFVHLGILATLPVASIVTFLAFWSQLRDRLFVVFFFHVYLVLAVLFMLVFECSVYAPYCAPLAVHRNGADVDSVLKLPRIPAQRTSFMQLSIALIVQLALAAGEFYATGNATAQFFSARFCVVNTFVSLFILLTHLAVAFVHTSAADSQLRHVWHTLKGKLNLQQRD